MDRKMQMRRKKHIHPALTDYQRQKKKARSLGYQTTEEYEQGLSIVKRLLGQKDKGIDAACGNPVGKLPEPVENRREDEL